METYYDPKDLAHFGDIGEDAPELWKKWLDWYNACFVEGALSEREKALIALADIPPPLVPVSAGSSMARSAAK